jgi:surfactin synthase thioesterase subunit
MVSFSGFPLGHPSYNQLYDPKVETPILHVIGTMDTMIDESQSLRLRDRCTDSSLHYFFGTHYVPRDTDFLEALTLFFDHVFKRKEGKEDEWEDLESR